MNPLIERQQESVAALCRRHQVRRLDLFGSATGEGFEPGRSDVDFLVEFAPIPTGQYADAFFGLREDLERLFGLHVDLITRGSVRNPYFLAAIEAQRERLFEA
ncbi:MAG: nucleotidyltransferase domain-containing protein [Rhodocyclaceae bacterium]|nr:nucleotidyltransferase domain-containing protein [Rhodocyclaceae bacterium]